jgi:hypothetical protein
MLSRKPRNLLAAAALAALLVSGLAACSDRHKSTVVAGSTSTAASSSSEPNLPSTSSAFPVLSQTWSTVLTSRSRGVNWRTEVRQDSAGRVCARIISDLNHGSTDFILGGCLSQTLLQQDGVGPGGYLELPHVSLFVGTAAPDVRSVTFISSTGKRYPATMRHLTWSVVVPGDETWDHVELIRTTGTTTCGLVPRTGFAHLAC